MKINKEKAEIILIVALYIFAIYMWSMPFQENRMPYGETDSGTHFTISDYMTVTDKAMYMLPAQFSHTYNKNNAGRIWYPPQFHLDVSIAQIVGRDRVISAFLFYAIICSSLVLSSYLLFRKLFGILIGFLSAFFLVFSTRDILWYVFGQYPQVASFAYIPIILYSYYKYVDSFFSDKKKPIYLYITAILLSIQFFFHPQGIVASGLIMALFSLFVIIKERKFFFYISEIAPSHSPSFSSEKEGRFLSMLKNTLRPLGRGVFDIRHALVFLLIIIILIAPFFSILLGKEGKFLRDLSAGSGGTSTAGFFYWTKTPKEPGVGYSGYYSYRTMNGLWTLPFVLLAISLLLIKRERKELLLLSWLIALFILFHESIIGGRAERFMEIESYLLWPLVIIGLLAIPQFFKLPSSIKKYIKYSLVVLFLVLVISLNSKIPYEFLKEKAYPGLNRLTPAQYRVAEWLMKNTDEENTEFYITGQLTYTKQKWMWALSHRSMTWSVASPVFNPTLLNECEPKCTHALVDYSDLVALNAQNEIKQLQGWEQTNLINASLIYNKYDIKVYKLG